MEFLTTIWNAIYSGGSYILPFLFVLGLVIVIHELGHYLAARSVGVHSEVFSVGFGPELFGFTDRRGTRWRFAAVPLGGYVKFLGDEDASSSTVDRSSLQKLSPEMLARSFPAQSVLKRSWIVFAGPFSNFILAIFVFAVLFMSVGKDLLAPRIDNVIAGSAAEMGGMKAGDLVLKIDGQPIESFSDMTRVVSINANKPLLFKLERAGAEVDVTITPTLKEKKTPFGIERNGFLGVSRSAKPEDVRHVRYGLVDSVVLGAGETWFIIERTLSYIGGLIMGTEKADQLSGPIRIAQISGEMASYGFAPLFQLVAILSVSIGFLNLLPVPILDGGHLVFYFFEWVLGKPVSDKVQEYGFKIGFALVILLMVFATWNDVWHLVSLG